MRILLVSNELTVTGAPNSLLRQARYFMSAGNLVDVWTFADGTLRPRYEEVGLSPELVEDSRVAIKRKYEDSGVRYDFIVCNTICTYRAADVLRRYGVPVVWFVRETRLLEAHHLLYPDFASVFDSFDNLYAVSEYCANIVRRYNTNVRVLLNAVADVYRQVPAPIGPCIGYIGSFNESKGVDVLLPAFREVRRRCPAAELFLVGRVATPYGQNLKSRYGDDAGVHWLGELQGDEKRVFFESVNILCVPSLDEPSGLTVLEGAMYGKAVVTTDHTGANYVVEGGGGRIVRAGSVSELAAALVELVELAPEALSALGARARENYLRFGTQERERADVLAMLEANRGCVPKVSGRLRSDHPFFYETRTMDGRRRFYAGKFRLFSLKGKGLVANED